MALEETQPLTGLITRNILGAKGPPKCKTDNLTSLYKPIDYKM
jgi:hypothetical protein